MAFDFPQEDKGRTWDVCPECFKWITLVRKGRGFREHGPANKRCPVNLTHPRQRAVVVS